MIENLEPDVGDEVAQYLVTPVYRELAKYHKDRHKRLRDIKQRIQEKEGMNDTIKREYTLCLLCKDQCLFTASKC